MRVRRVKKHVSDTRICLLLAMVIQLPLLSACNDTNAGKMAVSSPGQSGIRLPEVIQRATIVASGTLNAYLYCGENAQAVIMTISDDFARGSCTNLSLTQVHTIWVEFEFTSDMFGGPYLIATATKTGLSAVSTNTDVSFMSDDFDMTSDLDNDGISNLDELINGSDPASSLCVLGRSLIGQCEL